jgi:gentisate 1,2-dioxygenase
MIDMSTDTRTRQAFYDAISPLGLTPLWEVLHGLVPQQPNTPCLPVHWSYAAVRPYLMQSGSLITAQEAVRRVLILENPALRGHSCATQSLYAGLQLILPGEIAPSHRHTQSALRFIVEGSGAYTAVDGERTTMHEGDFIITPSWTWHDHGNESAQPMVWLDGLDIPLIRFLDAGFAENDVRDSQAIARSEGSSFATFGHNMAPVRHDGQYASPYGKTSPLFSYPYSRTREALDGLERSAQLDAWDGYKLRYLNPLSGGAPMPTMATFMQRLPAGFVGRPHRQTDGAVYSVVEGSGTATVKRQTNGSEQSYHFSFTQRDQFVVPSWHTLELQSESGCVLFSYSDRPVQQAIGVWREQRL